MKTRAIISTIKTLLDRWRLRRPDKEVNTGVWGEKVAGKWLSEHGYKILGKRVRPNRRDELDLVVWRDNVYVFVEVKTRRNERYGRPAAAVKAQKRHALCRAASAYLRKAGYPKGTYRFDIVEVIGEPGNQTPEIRHLEDAFRFEKRYRFPVCL